MCGEVNVVNISEKLLLPNEVKQYIALLADVENDIDYSLLYALEEMDEEKIEKDKQIIFR